MVFRVSVWGVLAYRSASLRLSPIGGSRGPLYPPVTAPSRYNIPATCIVDRKSGSITRPRWWVANGNVCPLYPTCPLRGKEKLKLSPLSSGTLGGRSMENVVE